MIKPSALLATAALACFAAAALAQSVQPVDVRATMQSQVNPAMLAIWEVSNAAMDEEGGIDPARVSAGQWDAVAREARQLAEAGRAMSRAAAILAAAPDNAEVGEGEVPMDKVQALIDADPAGFRAAAAAFAEHSDKLAAAAAAKDARAAGDLIAEMDGVCEACHAQYWYAE